MARGKFSRRDAMSGRVLLRRLCALAVLAVLLLLPPPMLLATCNLPSQVASVLADVTGPAGGGGACVPTSAVGSLLGFIGLCVWVYLVLVAILRAVAVLAMQARIAGATRLLAATNHFIGGRWVRRLVDVAIGLALVTAGGTGSFAPPSSPAGGPVVAAAGAVQAGSVAAPAPSQLAVDHSIASLDARKGERRYTVRPGDTLALIAGRELGDPALAALLFVLNQGRLMPDGARLDDADLLRPGWVLELPDRQLPLPPSTLPPPAATSSPPASKPVATSPQPPRPRVSVQLPSGSVVAFSLWLGMSSALLLALLRSRRTRRLEPPEPGICRYQPQHASVTEQLVDRGRAAIDQAASDHQPQEDDADQAQPQATPATLLPVSPLAGLDCVDPGRVPIGERDGQAVDLDLAAVGALVLVGPDATRAARAAVVTMLAQHNPFSAEVLVVGDLLGDIPEFPGLRRAGDLAAAFGVLEAEVLHRRRLLEAEDQDDFTGHRRTHPDDPLSALILLAEQVPAGEAGRLAALAAQGLQLGVGVLLVGAELHGAARIELDDAGRIAHATPAALASRLVGAQVFSLSQAEAADLLATLACSRATMPNPPQTAPQRPPVQEPFDPPAPAPSPPLQVRLLGQYRVETTGGQQLRGGRRKILELLAFYLLNPQGATLEQAVEALWPQAPLGREQDWFWNALASLRRAVRTLRGGQEAKLIARQGDRYRPDAALFEVDLWRLEAKLAEAKRAASQGDEQAETAALQAAADAYGGELLAGMAGAWVETPREDLRRRAVNALGRLAELREAAGDQQGALAALEQAVAADPVGEELYRRLMRLQARLGRTDAARGTFQALERHLAELDVDPEPETEALAAELLIPRRRRDPL
jgi:DNA-binding SARP family transcriptional activator